MTQGAAPVPSGPTIRHSIERVPLDLIKRAGSLPTSTLHEAGGRIGVLPTYIKPIAPRFRLAGPAVTVQGPTGDNLWLHRAIYIAEPGDVLVVQTGQGEEFGYWGEIMTHAAIQRGIAGLVIDGCVRDGSTLADLPFPVFARGFAMRGTGKDYGAPGWINHPTLFAALVVSPGDLIVGDGDGVVALPRGSASRIVAAAEEREEKEGTIIERIQAGERTLEVYNL